MKIFLTGKKGYVSKNLEKLFMNKNYCEDIWIESVRNGITEISLDGFDVCIHTAAIVHKKETNYTQEDYYRVNRDLTIELAKKAKKQGVKHFIYLSTMAVYGKSTGEISCIEALNPNSYYGKSKLAAEDLLVELENENFTVTIIRPPMIYGPNCPGNYSLLRKVAIKSPIFPKVDNKRSMIYIDNLCEFIFQVIHYRSGGIFHPQDKNYINTSTMVAAIAKGNNKKIYLNKLSGKILHKFFFNMNVVNKVIGDLIYIKNLSNYRDNSYQKINFEEAIQITEKEWKDK